MNLLKPIVIEEKNTENFSEIKQGLECLILTPAGSVLLDRNFGLDQSFLSKLADIAESLFIQELNEKAEMYMPEITINQVDFEYNEKGELAPTLYISNKDEYDYGDEERDDFSTDEDGYYYDDEDDPDADYYIADSEEDDE